MNINRYNYEEFFLLYVDNELSAAEIKTVEVFVQQNPDLHKELLHLQGSILQNDSIVFANKKELLKETDFTAWQEKLLLLVDNELPVSEKPEMEKFLATDAAAAFEWDLLQQVKLEPDSDIVFPDKASLYRATGGRVVGTNWWRVAAAAVLLGIGIWTGIAIYKNNAGKIQPGEGIAKEGTKPVLPKQTDGKTNPVPVLPGPNDQVTPDKSLVVKEQKNMPERVTENRNLPVKKTVGQKTNLEKSNIAIIVENTNNKKPSNNLPKPLENFNNNGSNKNSIVIVSPLVTENNNSIAKTDITVNKVVKPDEAIKPSLTNNAIEPANNYAKNIVYNGNAEEKDDTRILYMDEDKVKRTKIGGFLRKLKRVIERNTNLKTGNGVHVAGLEIAIK